MLIYRIENKMGVGPFTTGDDYAYDKAKKIGPFCNVHPLPTEDEGISKFWNDHSCSKYRYFFGFESLDQLKEWFPCSEGRKVLWDRGYSIKVYLTDPNDVFIGRNQICFVKENAVVLESMCI